MLVLGLGVRFRDRYSLRVSDRVRIGLGLGFRFG